MHPLRARANCGGLHFYSFVCLPVVPLYFGGGAINASVCVSVCFLNGRGDVLKSHKVPFVLPKEADNQHEAKDYVNHCPSRF